MANSFYSTQFSRQGGAGGILPTISTELDSVRAYQWEVQIQGNQNYTLAAKKVTSLTYTSEDIVVDRINDKVYYPGKAAPEEVTITFDNTLAGGVDKTLWELFTKTYDPASGQLGDANNIKFDMSLLLLSNDTTVHSTINLQGCYVKKYSLSELQYSENSFQTIDVTFRFDLMDVS